MGLNLTLDHINIRTANLEAMMAFYATVMDLKPGPRPPFGGPGVLRPARWAVTAAGYLSPIGSSLSPGSTRSRI